MRSVILLFVVFSSLGAFGRSSCPPQVRTSQESWQALYSSFRLYHNCDDGIFAEAYSDSIARLLVDHWGRFRQFALLSQKDSRFRRFVLRHIDSTLDDDDLRTIGKNPRSRCLNGQHELCNDVRKQANLALQELQRTK